MAVHRRHRYNDQPEHDECISFISSRPCLAATLSASPPALACVQITKAYGGGDARVFALRGVDLTVRDGETMMIVGPSGCGKTTLLSVISTLLAPDAGQCRIFGEDILEFSEQEKEHFRLQRIGFVFQSFNLLPALSARENVAIPLLLQGISRAKALDKAKHALSDAGLPAKQHALPGALSGGQKQRIAIARALVHDPQLIICDEPTSALDHRTGQQVMERLQHLVKTFGKTLIIVTHDSRIFEYADRIAHMDDGRILDIQKKGVSKS